MAQTQRTSSEIYTLLANNTTGAISPTDVRDAFATWRAGHGQIYVPAAAAAAISFSDSTSYVEVTGPAFTLSSGAHLFDESAGNGQLTYTGAAAVTVHVAASISMTASNNNQITHWRIGVNGTADAASEIQRKIGTAADVGSTALHLITSLTNGDYLSLFVRNASWTASETVTLEVGNLQAVTMPT